MFTKTGAYIIETAVENISQGKDYTVSTCDFGTSIMIGRKVTKVVSGCGGIFHGVCRSGCLKIMKARFSCWDKGGLLNEEDLDIVKSLCNNKAECEVRASREVFGSKSCPTAEVWEMSLRVTYRCDGSYGVDESYVTSTGCLSNICLGDQCGHLELCHPEGACEDVHTCLGGNCGGKVVVCQSGKCTSLRACEQHQGCLKDPFCLEGLCNYGSPCTPKSCVVPTYGISQLAQYTVEKVSKPLTINGTCAWACFRENCGCLQWCRGDSDDCQPFQNLCNEKSIGSFKLCNSKENCRVLEKCNAYDLRCLSLCGRIESKFEVRHL